jgi:hypothetical protein
MSRLGRDFDTYKELKDKLKKDSEIEVSGVLVSGDNIQIQTTKTPSSATDTGTKGMICWDSSYVYICVATDTWKRVAINTW